MMNSTTSFNRGLKVILGTMLVGYGYAALDTIKPEYTLGQLIRPVHTIEEVAVPQEKQEAENLLDVAHELYLEMQNNSSEYITAQRDSLRSQAHNLLSSEPVVAYNKNQWEIKQQEANTQTRTAINVLLGYGFAMVGGLAGVSYVKKHTQE